MSENKAVIKWANKDEWFLAAVVTGSDGHQDILFKEENKAIIEYIEQLAKENKEQEKEIERLEAGVHLRDKILFEGINIVEDDRVGVGLRKLWARDAQLTINPTNRG